MAAVPYFDLVRDLKNAYNFRLQPVQQARQHDIKPTAAGAAGKNQPYRHGAVRV